MLPISATVFTHKILWFFGPKIEENFGKFGVFFSSGNLTNFANSLESNTLLGDTINSVLGSIGLLPYTFSN
jgi:hypothetical protein